MLTPKEEAYIAALRTRLLKMRDYFVAHDIGKCGADALFKHLGRISSISGNLSNGRSFGACLLAKRYLKNRFKLEELDVGEKAQGAKGPDIDAKTTDGKRLLAEIKTTVPYELARSDFGAKQRTELRKDWKKLREAKAHHKFFFLTDRDAYTIVQKKYHKELSGIELILLGTRKKRTGR
jgi:hypothetical protein